MLGDQGDKYGVQCSGMSGVSQKVKEGAKGVKEVSHGVNGEVL